MAARVGAVLGRRDEHPNMTTKQTRGPGALGEMRTVRTCSRFLGRGCDADEDCVGGGDDGDATCVPARYKACLLPEIGCGETSSIVCFDFDPPMTDEEMSLCESPTTGAQPGFGGTASKESCFDLAARTSWMLNVYCTFRDGRGLGYNECSQSPLIDTVKTLCDTMMSSSDAHGNKCEC
jgi:hypothetical protein